MHHFLTEACTHVHISVTKWCIVGYRVGALWGLCDRCIRMFAITYIYCAANFVTWPQNAQRFLNKQVYNPAVSNIGLILDRLRYNVACLNGSEPVSNISNHANTQFTHVTKKWSIVQSDWSNVMKFACYRTSVFKTGLYERHSLSRNRGKWQCITVVILKFTGPWVLWYVCVTPCILCI